MRWTRVPLRSWSLRRDGLERTAQRQVEVDALLEQLLAHLQQPLRGRGVVGMGLVHVEDAGFAVLVAFLHGVARAQQPSGLFPHGFNTLTNESSCCAWGRANGWVAMSLVELLWALPQGAAERPAVLGAFSRLAGGLLQAQDATDGRWHQVLDDSSTFLETSATAMFTFALATGIVEGWLPRATYGGPVGAAWAGLLRAVRQDGSVDGICQGTPVELDVAAYNSRTTFYNMSDPGLGAVFRAAMAVQQLQHM